LPGVAIVVGSTNDLKPASLICVRRKEGIPIRVEDAARRASRLRPRRGRADDARNYSGRRAGTTVPAPVWRVSATCGAVSRAPPSVARRDQPAVARQPAIGST
jgi:hypothetical protein